MTGCVGCTYTTFKSIGGSWFADRTPPRLTERNREEHALKRFWRDYNLGVVFFALFAVSWVVQTYTGWKEFAAEQATLGAAATGFGDGGYV